MRSSPLSLKRALLLSAFFAMGVVAQNNNNNNNNNDKTTATQKQTSTQATSSTQAQQTSSTSQTSTQATSSSSTDSPPPLTSTSSSSTSALTGLPALTSSSSEALLTGLPTLSKTSDDSIPTYPAPTIPPTQHAPFMNHSTLPDGTVFIAVGAILGAFGVAILAWRGIVACLLHRSVERAALAQHAANNGRTRTGGGADKNAASFPAPPAQFYKYIERESSPSLAGAGLGGGSTGRRTHRGPTPSATPSQTNLFFSPTAAGSTSGLAGVTGGGSNRDSARFLPSGFYASASSPGPGGHGHGNSISMSTLRPSSRGRGGAGQLGPSPPESPDVGPRVVSRNFSTSSLNLNRPPSAGTRAPSAYLDDLLDEQPGQFPPAAGAGSPTPGGHGRRY